MILPRQFWDFFDECQITFTIHTGLLEAESVVKVLKRQIRKASTEHEGGSASKRRAYDISSEFLQLAEPIMAEGIRVVKAPRAEAKGVLMVVAMPISKHDFEERVEAAFKGALREVCGGHTVTVENVAAKPSDFRGGGELKHPQARASAICIHLFLQACIVLCLP